jgi:2-hydroxy-6-oxonona-2,4-dienedioate hydrolase
MLHSILPISRRVAGIRNDSIVSANLTRYDLEDMGVPTLVISASDDLYGTYESGFYTAAQISEGRFTGFPTGGHLLLGHDAQVRAEVTGFVAEQREARERTPMAV